MNRGREEEIKTLLIRFLRRADRDVVNSKFPGTKSQPRHNNLTKCDTDADGRLLLMLLLLNVKVTDA